MEANASIDMNALKGAAAEGVATKYYFWHDSEGAHVSTVEGDATTGKNLLLTGNMIQLRDGTTVLAEFTNTQIQLGTDNSYSSGGLLLGTDSGRLYTVGGILCLESESGINIIGPNSLVEQGLGVHTLLSLLTDDISLSCNGYIRIQNNAANPSAISYKMPVLLYEGGATSGNIILADLIDNYDYIVIVTSKGMASGKTSFFIQDMETYNNALLQRVYGFTASGGTITRGEVTQVFGGQTTHPTNNIAVYSVWGFQYIS